MTKVEIAMLRWLRSVERMSVRIDEIDLLGLSGEVGKGRSKRTYYEQRTALAVACAYPDGEKGVKYIYVCII